MNNTSIPNCISILRIVFAPLCAFFLGINKYLACFIFALAAMTDFLDGYLARKFNIVSDFGKIIDPLADKIFINTVGIAMCHKLEIPGFFYIVVTLLLLRDTALISGFLYSKLKHINIKIDPLFISKICTTYLMCLYTFLILFTNSPYANILIYVGCTLIFISAAGYFARSNKFYRVVKNRTD